MSRPREIFLAKQIEITRKRMRRTVIESDFALTQAVETIEKVHQGNLPFERTLRTSETENVRKEQIEGRMESNLKTLRHMMAENRRDFDAYQEAPSRSIEQKEILQRMTIRRRKMCTLCEELSVRTHRLQPIIKRMLQIGDRIREIHRELKMTAKSRDRQTIEDRRMMQKELEDIVDMLVETPEQFLDCLLYTSPSPRD